MPGTVPYKQLLHERGVMDWALPLSFSCHENHPLYLGNPIAWIFTGSAFFSLPRWRERRIVQLGRGMRLGGKSCDCSQELFLGVW